MNSDFEFKVFVRNSAVIPVRNTNPQQNLKTKQTKFAFDFSTYQSLSSVQEDISQFF